MHDRELGCKLPSNSPVITGYWVILAFFGTEVVPHLVILRSYSLIQIMTPTWGTDTFDITI